MALAKAVTQGLTPLPPTVVESGSYVAILLLPIDVHKFLYNTIGFVMTPSPLNVTVEQGVATFYCQHGSSNDIAWRIDGTSPNVIPTTSTETVSLSGGGLWSSLSIATLPEYNRTTIDCVAVFYQGLPLLQFTESVTLLIQGMSIRSTHYSDVSKIFWCLRYTWKYQQSWL